MNPSDGARDSTSGTSSWGAEDAEQQQSPQVSLEHVVDDFSLQSQGIRFRAAGKEMKIYDQAHGQLLLEERYASLSNDVWQEQEPQHNEGETKSNNTILVKSTHEGGYALSFLRAAYSLMAVFVGGFIFILGTAILLFLFIDLVVKLGITTVEDARPVSFVCVLFSVPVFIYSLAMGMTLVMRFVMDTFRGHPFLQSFGIGVATTDWLAFVMYLGTPTMALIITLLSKKDNWWELSLLAWFASIIIFFCFFAACELWLEVWACLELMEEDDGSSLIDGDPWKARVLYWFKLAVSASKRTKGYRMSGKHTYFKKVSRKSSTIVPDTAFNCINYISGDLVSETPYSYIANKEWNSCFYQKSPEQIRSLDEVLGNTYFVTRDSWSLEKLFFRKGDLRSTIPITQGESSITKEQISSNIACNLLGNIIIVLLFFGLVTWFDFPPAVLVVFCVAAVVLFIKVGFATRRLVALRRDIVNEESHTIYRYYERYQHSMPKDHFIWATIFIQMFFLFLLPLIFLAMENPKTAIIFALLGLFSALRHYMNPRILLMESKNKDYFNNSLMQVKTKEDKKEWRKKSRMYHIVAVGGDKARHFWTYTYITLVVFFAIIGFIALSEDGQIETNPDTAASTKMTIVEGFTYNPQPYQTYPTCRLKKGFDGNIFELADFAFLSGLAYATDATATAALNTWFGEGAATNNIELIQEFKSSSSYKDFGFGPSVSYKLITFSDSDSDTDSTSVLTIRGTATVTDLIADAQLWLPAMLFQGLRFLLPVSGAFTPILHHMVYIVSRFESERIKEVSYYRETTNFVHYLKDQKGFEKLSVTGHSLGGGLAIITGAQTNTNVVALSGPNAMLSRKTFLPPILPQSLDTFTFNVVPARDPISKIDDKAMLYQNINCTAAANNFFGCHKISRTLCEIQYTCGSAGQPVLCECVLDHGYPEPQPTQAAANGTTATTTQQKTFLEKCIDICVEETQEKGLTHANCDRWKEEAMAVKKKRAANHQTQLMPLVTG